MRLLKTAEAHRSDAVLHSMTDCKAWDIWTLLPVLHILHETLNNEPWDLQVTEANRSFAVLHSVTYR